MVRRRKRRGGATQYELGRAAIYSRVSGPADTREASLETQEAAIARRLRELGYECGDEDIFRDKFTGKETIRRPALNRLREFVRQGVYKAVGVYKLDRLARNMGHSFILLGEMDELNVRPVSVMEPDIDNSAQGKVYRLMGAYMAEAELANFEDRFGRGKEHIQARGLPLSAGRKAYGLIFDKASRTYSLDEDRPDHDGTIKWVRTIFRMAAEGSSGYTIADHLNGLGVRPPGLATGIKYQKRPHAGQWRSTVVLTIIRNPAYKGWTVENKYYSEGVTDHGNSIMRRVPEQEWLIHDKSGAITPRTVDDETWEAANATIDANAHNRNSAGKKVHDYLLRGMIFCSRCGAKRYGKVNRHGNLTYHCSNHILVIQKERPESMRCGARHVRGRWIEPLVWRELESLLLEPGRAVQAYRESLAGASRDRTEADLKIARANVAEQERIREKLYRRWREEDLRSDPDAELAAKFEADYRAMKAPIDSLRRTVAALEAKLAASLSPEALAQRVEETFAEVIEDIRAGREVTPERKRRLLVLVQTRVTVEGDGKEGSGQIDFSLFNTGNQLPGSSAGS
jgi:site-specific DNA recombinase